MVTVKCGGRIMKKFIVKMAINFQHFNKEHEFVILIFQRQMIVQFQRKFQRQCVQRQKTWMYKGYF